MSVKADPSRAVQIGFLLLLAFASAQVAWWIAENTHYSRSVEERLGALYRVQEGTDAAPLLAQLAQERENRINRYRWEGGFFIFVLIGGMSVLTSVIRLDSRLRRRQQNFLAAVSHEFKSPLASIRLAAETLALRSKEADTARLAERILADDERLLRMVENLLDSARLEQGRHTLRPEVVDLEAALRAQVGALVARAAAQGVEMTIDATPVSLRADRTAIETILRNLLDNALKSCVAAGSHRVVARLQRGNGQIVLAVEDDGLGFEQEEAAQIFGKFYRIGDELRRQTQGTGLGLYLVKRLVMLSGAAVDARSPGPGRGATMTVTWPDSYLA